MWLSVYSLKIIFFKHKNSGYNFVLYHLIPLMAKIYFSCLMSQLLRYVRGVDDKTKNILKACSCRSSVPIDWLLDLMLLSQSDVWQNVPISPTSGTASFKKFKQLFESQHFLLLRNNWWSKFYSIFKFGSFFLHQC